MSGFLELFNLGKTFATPHGSFVAV